MIYEPLTPGDGPRNLDQSEPSYDLYNVLGKVSTQNPVYVDDGQGNALRVLAVSREEDGTVILHTAKVKDGLRRIDY